MILREVQGAHRALRFWRAALGCAIHRRDLSLTSFRMLYDLREQGFAPATVIDVGANRGQFSVAAREIFPDAVIFSFEPSRAAFRRLRAQADADSNWFVQQIAVGATEGEANLHLNAHSQSSSLLDIGERHLQAFPTAVSRGTERVEISSLDVFLAGRTWPRPCVLKVDTQGFELPVLEGAATTLTRVDSLIIELSFVPLYYGEAPFREMLTAIEELGFEFARPVGLLRDPTTREVLQIDGLFHRSKPR